ncbi:MAG TPA: response regulator [Cyclobacteriaceae bacterium]|nr:response regulator [Cyclobacteriaceae bacterium]HMV08158.1 response regulator [Cyclobacteriaceae bacterium]HMX00799.1 response regulator [Cyclobacteriaceae bacterium]HMX49326.1 response regulator [Cyclobacteriaceae bacterium]HMY93602.1 response regulator [Cyclobacteriaceae bacterium]
MKELKKNILLVDDDKINHFINEQLITSMGLANHIYKAFNGLEALRILKFCCENVREKLDVILLDLHMPVMDGFAFMEAFQELECVNKKYISVALVTSSHDPGDMEKARLLGVHHFFAKPLSPEYLRTIFNG